MCWRNKSRNSFKLFINLYKCVTQKSREYNAALSESVYYFICKIHLQYKHITISLNQMYRPLTYHDTDRNITACVSLSELQYCHKMLFFCFSLIQVLVLQISRRSYFHLLFLLCEICCTTWKLHNCKKKKKRQKRNINSFNDYTSKIHTSQQ